jgi:hypothetical protein
VAVAAHQSAEPRGDWRENALGGSLDVDRQGPSQGGRRPQILDGRHLVPTICVRRHRWSETPLTRLSPDGRSQSTSADALTTARRLALVTKLAIARWWHRARASWRCASYRRRRRGQLAPSGDQHADVEAGQATATDRPLPEGLQLGRQAAREQQPNENGWLLGFAGARAGMLTAQQRVGMVGARGFMPTSIRQLCWSTACAGFLTDRPRSWPKRRPILGSIGDPCNDP